MRRRHLVAGLAAGLPVPTAWAQGGAAGGDALPYPRRPVMLVVATTAGSTNDVFARLLAAEVAPRLGQAMPVDNRPGAGGSVALAWVVRARAEGHVLALVSTSTIPINRAYYRNLTYDPQHDLVPVSISGGTPNALVVPAGDDRPRDVAELLARGRDPSLPPLRHVSPGNGTSHHLACVQLRRAAGTGFRSQHIPYRGPAESLAGLLAGDGDWGFPALPSVLRLSREGRVRVLGVTGHAPAAPMPEAPTLASQGLVDFAEMDVWYGVAAPRAGMPPEALAMLRRVFREALAEPRLQARLATAGFHPIAPMEGAAMESFIARQVALWEEIVHASATFD